jgi:hypothetical protein
MSARFLTAYLATAALLVGLFTQAAAKPPQLPAKYEIECDQPASPLVVRVYSVADLVIPLDNAGRSDATPAPVIPPGAAKACPQACGNGKPAGVKLAPPPVAPLPMLPPSAYQYQPEPLKAENAKKPCCPFGCVSKDGKDVQLHVQETPTGSLLFGYGVNSDAGLTGSFAINERNLDITRAAAEPMPAPAPCSPAWCAVMPPDWPQKTLEERLIKLIVTMIKPESWDEMGGSGTIDYFPLGMALVINQTPEIQEQVAELLAALRHLQDEEVAVEMRVVTVPAEYFDKVVKDLGLNLKKCEPGCCAGPCPEACQKSCPADSGCNRLAFLNDSQVAKLFDKLQADPHTNLMQAPKLTMFNGQASTLTICEDQFFVTGMDFQRMGDQVIFFPKNEPVSTGLKMTVQPVISADNRFVRLSLEARLSEVDSPVPLYPITTFTRPIYEGGAMGEPVPFTAFIQQPVVLVRGLNKTVCIPDGGTLLLRAWDNCRQIPEEVEIPILSRIPYVNELFKNVRYHEETTTTVVMVTPRIICKAEQETPKAVATETTPSVIENLQKLEQAQRLFKEAEQHRRHGQKEWAAHAYQRIQELCSGSRVAQIAARRYEEMHVPKEAPKSLVITGQQITVASSRQKLTGHGAMPANNVQKNVCELLDKYYQACAEGRLAEATQWAVQALALDPACFSREKNVSHPMLNAN